MVYEQTEKLYVAHLFIANHFVTFDSLLFWSKDNAILQKLMEENVKRCL